MFTSTCAVNLCILFKFQSKCHLFSWKAPGIFVSFPVAGCFAGNNTEVKLSHTGYSFQVRHSGYGVIKCKFIFFFILKWKVTTALQLSIHQVIFFILVIDEWCLQICFWSNCNWTSKFHMTTLKKEMELNCSPCVVWDKFLFVN